MTTTLLVNGRSQGVRILRELRFEAKEVWLRRLGGGTLEFSMQGGAIRRFALVYGIVEKSRPRLPWDRSKSRVGCEVADRACKKVPDGSIVIHGHCKVTFSETPP